MTMAPPNDAVLDQFCFFGLPRRSRLQYASDFTQLTLQSASPGMLALDEWIADGLQRYKIESPALAACFNAVKPTFATQLTRNQYCLLRSLLEFHPGDLMSRRDEIVAEIINDGMEVGNELERENVTANFDSCSQFFTQFHLQLIFRLFDRDHDSNLNLSELMGLLRTLAKGNTHTTRMMQEMTIPQNAFVSLARFLVTAEQTFGTWALDTRSFLHSLQTTEQAIDPRTTAAIPDGVVFEMASILSPHIILQETVLGGREGAEQLTAESQSTGEPVGPVDLNAGLVFDPSMIGKETHWRGYSAQPRTTLVYDTARQVVNQAGMLIGELQAMKQVRIHQLRAWRESGTTHDYDSMRYSTAFSLFDQPHWRDPGSLLAKLFNSLDTDQILRRFQRLASDCRRVVRAQPMVVRVNHPVKVFGDSHGHLVDLLLLFAEFGSPCHRGGDVEAVSYVFTGDYIDNGPHQLETTALLFALKVAYPSRVFLLRGKHESKSVNFTATDGFLAVCNRFFPPAFGFTESPFYVGAHEVFEYLPIAALIKNRLGDDVMSNKGDILIVHGGIGDGSYSVKDLEELPRPLNDENMWGIESAVQTLWSDPSDSDRFMARGLHQNPRGAEIVTFGPDVTQMFCKANKLALVIRSSQCVSHGFKLMHGGRLMNVFSAKDYIPGTQNDAAVLLIAVDEDGLLRVRPKRIRSVHVNIAGFGPDGPTGFGLDGTVEEDLFQMADESPQGFALP